jgi:ferredoxin/flavodoxin---NADP+ reductase
VSQIGSSENPLRVAIIGAGPAGFYAADHLLKQGNLVVEVDMYDRLPTPHGLVRVGVAPDHQKIKSVTKAFDKVASRPEFRFFGNVEIGEHVTVAELRNFYHQIVYTTGAQTDRFLDIPGADLQGSHAATEFVAWYNGHPDFRACRFDLTQERAAVIGVGNVAVDVARILCRTPEELEKTDIADYALEALRHSRVKEVYILGRRGPVQAAFTTPEIKELGEMADADIVILPEEAELDDLSQKALAEADERSLARKVEIIQQYSRAQPKGKSRRLILRFLVSPTELIGDDEGRVKAMRIVRNELYLTEAGTLRSRYSDHTEELPVGLVFRSIGYRGVPVPGVPFHDRWGVILNDEGRVLDPETQRPQTGEYTAGWIKRGPTGVIGTNKPDAVETVEHMLQDLKAGQTLQPAQPQATAVEQFMRQRQPHYFSYSDWLRLDELEVARGTELGRPRLKFTSVAEMMAALGKK